MTEKEMILQAYGEIEDCFIEESLEFSGTLKRISPWRWVAAAALVILLFSTAYQVNAQFRKWIISIVPVTTREQIKEKNTSPGQGGSKKNEEGIEISEVKEIGNVLEAQYITANHYVEPYQDIYISTDQGKESYFSIQGNAIVPISNIRHIKRKIQWKKYTGWINADVISDQGNQYVYNLTPEKDVPNNGQCTFSLSQDDVGEYWVTASAESQMEQYSYPLEYNVNTKKLTDIFGDIMIRNKSLQKYHVVTNWGKLSDRLCCVLVGDTQKDAVYYLIDVTDHTAVSMEKLTKMDDICFVRGLDHSVIFGTISTEQHKDSGDVDGSLTAENEIQDYYDCYRLDLQTGEQQELYHHVQIWSEDPEEDDSDKVAFTGGRYDLLEQRKAVYLVDELTGERTEIEKFDGNLEMGSVLVNDSGDKLLFGGQFTERCVRKIGVLDIPKKKLYLIDRENLTSYDESALSWKDDMTFVIRADRQGQQGSALFCYRIK